MEAASAGCTQCKLSQGRNTIVFGAGDPAARLVIIGEGPGEEEDRQGKPFVGRAGQLLTKMLDSVGITREEVYICNIVKCRPPGNRNPEPEEIAACAPYLAGQLAAIQPGVICTLGTFASQHLLRTREPISRLRGQLHQLGGAVVVPMFHPAFLLRNPGPALPASGVRRPQAHPARVRPGPGPGAGRRLRPDLLLAHVVTDLPVPRTFTYRVPPELEARVAPGQRVRVPFRGRPRPGVVVRVEAGAGPGTRLSSRWRPCSIPCRR